MFAKKKRKYDPLICTKIKKMIVLHTKVLILQLIHGGFWYCDFYTVRKFS
jgi:hypothetical protein